MSLSNIAPHRHHGTWASQRERVTRAVIGAAEQLTYRILNGDDIGNVATIPGELISLVMDGLRPPKD